MIIDHYINLQEYTKNTIIPEHLRLTTANIKQLYDIVDKAPNGNGLFIALNIAFKAGYEAGLEYCGKGKYKDERHT